MDETEFLRGIEGEQQQGSDLVSGAEHLVRLKIQSGQQTQQQYPDLEIEKKASVSESIGSAALCKSCGKEKCACMGKAKTAEALKQLLREKLAQPDWNQTMLRASAGIGALAGGVGTYLASRPQKDTGKGKAEEELEAMIAAQKMKPERGFLQKLKNRETENAHGFAKAFREHPGKGALLGALTGAAGGYSIGQLGGALSRLRGGK
jgi:hypothetical protein